MSQSCGVEPSFCNADSKRWDCNLSEDLPPEIGHLGRGAPLRKPEPECVAGVSASKLQDSLYDASPYRRTDLPPLGELAHEEVMACSALRLSFVLDVVLES